VTGTASSCYNGVTERDRQGLGLLWVSLLSTLSIIMDVRVTVGSLHSLMVSEYPI
jgi:hypothetical protein